MSKHIRSALTALVVLAGLLFAPAGLADAATASHHQDRAWTVRTSPEGSIAVGPLEPASDAERRAFDNQTTAIGFHDTLTLNPRYFTGLYKTVAVSGPHVTRSPVYKRAYRACHTGNGLWQSCMTGTIITANGYAACGSTCTIAGLRGTHSCQTDGSGGVGYDVDLTACGETRFDCGLALHVWERDKVKLAVPVATWMTLDWHINVYSGGTFTGPFSGAGAVTC